MRISVVIVTYCRDWALRHCLESLTCQKRPPDEVLVVLKPCGDGSVEVLSKFVEKLPLRIIYQSSGSNVTDAYELGYLNAVGDVILFLDDDAIAHEEWVLRYERLFNEIADAAGFTGLVYKSVLKNGNPTKTRTAFYAEETTKDGPHRRPLPELKGYCGWISTSGLTGKRSCNDYVNLSIMFSGVNMGFRSHVIRDMPLSYLYKRSRKGFWFEKLLAYWCAMKGFKTYNVLGEEISPLVWHIEHGDSLTRRRGFWDEFWTHYDRVAMFWRLRRFSAGLSRLRYALALLVIVRRKTLPRLLATLYGLLYRV